MTRRRGRRRGPAGTGGQVSAALEKWRGHTRDCYQCHHNAGHPGLYCDAGYRLAQAVTQARNAARIATEVRARNQGALW